MMVAAGPCGEFSALGEARYVHYDPFLPEEFGHVQIQDRSPHKSTVRSWLLQEFCWLRVRMLEFILYLPTHER